MPRYLIGLALAGALAVDPWVMTPALAGGGEVLIMREVPYQPANGPRHTGRVNAVDVSPDSHVTSMVNAASTRGAGALIELTDHESSAIASGAGNSAAGLISGLQSNPALKGVASGKLAGAPGGAFSAAGAPGSATSNMGSGAGGSVGRATDALSNTLNGALFRTGGMK